jgi:toxin ParE1/3/4
MGRIVPELEDDAVRELIFQNYRVIYRPEHGSIGVIAVIHASMDFTSTLAPRLWDIT